MSIPAPYLQISIQPLQHVEAVHACKVSSGYLLQRLRDKLGHSLTSPNTTK